MMNFFLKLALGLKIRNPNSPQVHENMLNISNRLGAQVKPREVPPTHAMLASDQNNTSKC